MNAKIIATMALGALIALGSSPAAQASEPSLLFVQSAKAGRLYRAESGKLKLELAVSSWTTTFADRPQRRAGRERTSAFRRRWAARGFRSDPPNAALSIDGAKRGGDVIPLEISKPRYRPSRRMIRYSVRPLRGALGGSLKGFDRRADDIRLGRFGAASLFIDDGDPFGFGDDFNPFTGEPSLLFVVFSELDSAFMHIEIEGADANIPYDPAFAVPTIDVELFSPTLASVQLSQVDGGGRPAVFVLPVSARGDFDVNISNVSPLTRVSVNLNNGPYSPLEPGSPVSFSLDG